MNDIIKELIDRYEQKGDFNYANVSDEMIEEAEKALKVKLPNQYVEYLKKYGHGGIAGIEIIGVGLSGKLIFVDETLEYREEGLPISYVVIENVDEWVMCIDCEDGRIKSWDYSGYVKDDYNCFDDYLLDQIKNAIDNL